MDLYGLPLCNPTGGQDQPSEVEFKVSREKHFLMLGAAIDEGGEWSIHSLWLEWRYANRDETACTLNVTSRGPGKPRKGKRGRHRRTPPRAAESDLMTFFEGKPMPVVVDDRGISLRVDDASEGGSPCRCGPCPPNTPSSR